MQPVGFPTSHHPIEVAAISPPEPFVPRPFRDQVDDAEREIIRKTLSYTRDNVTEAARLLDLERGHFYKKMKALGMRRGKDEAGGPEDPGLRG
jgi:DNA-binding NtrC family response regulator